MPPSAAVGGALGASAQHRAGQHGGIPPRQQKPVAHACDEVKHPHPMPPSPTVRMPVPADNKRLKVTPCRWQGLWTQLQTPTLPSDTPARSGGSRAVQRCSFLPALEQAIADHPSLSLPLPSRLPSSLFAGFPLHVAFSTAPVSPRLRSLSGAACSLTTCCPRMAGQPSLPAAGSDPQLDLS